VSTESEPAVVWDVHDLIAVLRFNRPRQRNAMTADVQDAFAEALSELASWPGLAALILTGNGPAFSAGGDMELMRSLPALGTDEARDRLATIYPPFISLLDFPTPTIAAVNGPAVGGGLGIALLCDIRVASTSASFSAPFGMIGLPPGMGLTFLLPHLLGTGSALELLLTSRPWDAATSERRGLVSGVVEDSRLLEEARRLALSAANSSLPVINEVVRRLRDPIRRGVHDALLTEVTAQADAVGHPDYLEGLNAISEKRRPSFRSRWTA
jgi:enoyl-CoA hydratase/carnithine racemase